MTTNGICKFLQMAAEMAAQHRVGMEVPPAGKHPTRQRPLHLAYRSLACGLPRNVRCGAAAS